MAVRLFELHRVLKTTGSLYLHCDPTASHYLKIVLDTIFGRENFRNEIVWTYRTGGVSKRYWPRKHDILLFYTKNENLYKHKSMQERIYYDKPFFSDQKDEEGKYYADVYIRDVWEDIKPLINMSKERLGYPTQKPLALLERIIEASSNEGELVLDPFCGCGTTVAAAEKLKRDWIGIDITYSAISAIRERFRKQKLNIWGDIEVINEPKTLQDLEKLHRHSILHKLKEYEKVCVSLVGGLPNDKMGADGGIDGRIVLEDKSVAIISVKSGDNVNVKDVRELKGLLNENQPAGVFITLKEPTREMINFANQAGIYKLKDSSRDNTGNFFAETAKGFPKIQILTLKNILDGELPKLPYLGEGFPKQ